MATFFLALGIDPATAVDPQSDGLHRDGQYGFAIDAGSGPRVLGNGSGSSGRQFEAVQMNLRDGSNQHQLIVILFANVSGIVPQSSYLRLAFRPGHTTPPPTSGNADASPLAGNDTQSLMNGVLLTACTNTLSGGGNGATYGLPSSSYSSAWQFPAYSLTGPPNSSATFELTAEITVLTDTTYNFKVDPEMMIDF
jgi:hypothetical protein